MTYAIYGMVITVGLAQAPNFLDMPEKWAALCMYLAAVSLVAQFVSLVQGWSR